MQTFTMVCTSAIINIGLMRKSEKQVLSSGSQKFSFGNEKFSFFSLQNLSYLLHYMRRDEAEETRSAGCNLAEKE